LRKRQARPITEAIATTQARTVWKWWSSVLVSLDDLDAVSPAESLSWAGEKLVENI